MAALAGAGRPGRGRPRRRGAGLGPARLPPPGPAPARRGRRDRAAPRRPGARHPRRSCWTCPGVGAYTAAAVASFAFGRHATVVDTNIRRVHARAVERARPAGAGADPRRDRRWPTGCCPGRAAAAATWNVAVMELGALVCTARSPAAPPAPSRTCARGSAPARPAYDGPARRGQAWHGTDRQCRGALLAVLRAAPRPVTAGRAGRRLAHRRRASASAAWTAWWPTAWSSRCRGDGSGCPSSEAPAPAGPSRQDGQHAAESPG